MKKSMKLALTGTILVLVLSATAQQQNQQQNQPQQRPQNQQATAKLEAILNKAQIPFTKTPDGTYVAVISVDQNESERFHIDLVYLGNDPNDARYQLVQMYFLLAQLEKGASFPPALLKQVNQWNANLTVGKILVYGNVMVYNSTSWLERTDAEYLALDATLGHYSSQDLRKEIAPYLKQ